MNHGAPAPNVRAGPGEPDLGEQIVRAVVRRVVRVILWGLLLLLLILGAIVLFMQSGSVQPLNYRLF